MRLCVIPARGGSKRIPRKNIRPFCGSPIIGYSIATARNSGCFDRIIVSTDDEEIAEVAQSCGADTPFLRPRALADDQTGTNPVVSHAINWFAERGERIDLTCCIYATAPFLQPDDVRAGLAALERSDAVFAVTVTSFPFPIYRAVQVSARNRLRMLWPEHEQSRSQDLPEAYHDAGAMYWGRADAFRRGLSLFKEHTAAVKLPRHRVQDIDTLEDWRRAELMYRAWVQASG